MRDIGSPRKLMPLNLSAIKAGDLLKTGVAEGDWRQVARARERIVELLFSAVGAGAGDTIVVLRDALSSARNEMVWRYKTSVSEDPGAISWMLESDVQAARVAERLRPATSKPVADPANVRIRILEKLSSTDRELTTQELAKACDAADSTVARLLPVMRDEGLVLSRKAGRHVLNRLTPKGRAVYRDQNADHMRRRRVVPAHFVPKAVAENDINPSEALLEVEAPPALPRDDLMNLGAAELPLNSSKSVKAFHYS